MTDYCNYKPHNYRYLILYENTKVRIEYNIILTASILFTEKGVDNVFHQTHYLFNPVYYDASDYKYITNKIIKLVI